MIAENSSKTYLDYSATTPLDERVFAAMLPYLQGTFGNPSSVHGPGQAAAAAVEDARDLIADYLNATREEIVFTSGGTESDNLALRGVAFAARRERDANHILISPVEHHAVSVTAQQLADQFGFELEYLPVDAYGRVNLGEVADRLRTDTAIVSVIYANNEIGTINPIAEIGAACTAQGIPFHTDAVQAGAYLPLDTEALKVDLLSLGAHKFYGPKGIGVLYKREGTALQSLQTGGGQEHGLRAGTSNVAYIVGMAKALELAQEDKEALSTASLPLRNQLIHQVLERIPDAALTGHPTERLPHHASFLFVGVDGNQLLNQLDVLGFACSSGSACTTGNPEPSDVLLGLGIEPNKALGSLRVTLGRSTTALEIDAFLRALPEAVERNRALQGVAP
jgi:cysteine desulfurase